MADDDHGYAQLCLQTVQLLVHMLAQGWILGAEGFIKLLSRYGSERCADHRVISAGAGAGLRSEQGAPATDPLLDCECYTEI